MNDSPWRDPEVLERMYREQEMAMPQIADELDVAVSTIHKYLNRHGIETRTHTSRKDVPFRNAETLRRLYWDEGLTIGEVASETGASKTTIKKWMNHHDIPRRDSVEASKAARRVERATFITGTDGYEFWQSRTEDGLKHVYVHRLLAVAEFGFETVCGNIVHHRNNISWDNQHENIAVMSRSDHSDIHNTGGVT
jgi:transposase